MGDQNIIEISLNHPKVKKEVRIVVDEMENLLAVCEKLESKRISLGNITGRGELKAIQTEIKAGFDSMAASIDKNNIAIGKLIDQQQKQATAAKAATEATKQQTEAAKQFAAAKTAEAKASTEAAKQKNIEAKTNAVIAKEQERQMQVAKKKADEATKNSAKESKAIEDLSNDYKQLSIAYNEAALKAKNLALQQGSNSPAAKAAAADAKALGDKLKEVDAAVGQNQRKVGSYGEAISVAFGKAFSALSRVANILPGLGLSGLFLLLYEGVIKLASGLDFLTPKFDKIKDAHKGYTEVVSKASDEYAKAKVEVSSLAEKINLAQKGFLDKSAVLKEYNETLGKTIGHANNLAEAEQRIIDKGPAYIKFTFAKAQAQAAADLAVEQSAISVKAQAKSLEDFVDNGDATVSVLKTFFTQINPFASQGEKAAKVAQDLLKKATNTQKKEITEAETRFNKFLELQKKFLGDAAKISDQNKFDFFGGKQDEKEKNIRVAKPVDFTKDIEKANEDLFKAQFEGQKISLESRREYLQAILADEKDNYATRIAAAQQLADVELEIARDQRDKELILANDKLDVINNINKNGGVNSIQSKLNEIAVIETIEDKERSLSQKRLINQKDALVEQRKLLLQEPVIRQEILNMNAALADKETSIEAGKTKKLEEIRLKAKDALLVSVKDAVDKDQYTVTTDFINKEADALHDLNTRYSEGKLTLKQYNEEKEKLTQRNTLAALKLEEEGLYDLLEAYEFLGEDTTEIWRKIADNHKKYEEAKTATTQTEAKKREDIEKQAADKWKEVAQATFNLGVAFVDGGFDNAKNKIREQMDLNDQRYEREIQNINASSLSAQQKESEVALAEARRDAQKQQLERRQREIAVKQARFDRDAQALSIFGNAVAAHFTLIKQLGVAGLPIALANDALAAVQIATLYAKPLPKFFRGKDENNKYEGYGIVNDGGKAEPIKRADGSIEFNKAPLPKVTYLNKDDIVYPDVKSFMLANPGYDLAAAAPLTGFDSKEAMIAQVARGHAQLIMRAAQAQITSNVSAKMDTEKMERKLDKVVSAIQQIRNPKIKFTWRDNNQNYKDAQDWDEYLKRTLG